MKKLVPGVALCVAIALVATGLGRLVPIVGAPVFGILIGVIIAAFVKPGAPTDAGARWAGRAVLQSAVVVLGTGLALGQVARVGLASLPVMLGTLVICLFAAWMLGRALGIRDDLRTLIGVGTGICGASAIAATTAVIGASEADVAYAIGTIFTFNIAAVLLFPLLGHLLGMSQHAFGLWAGTAINDTSSVVAASASYGAVAAQYGVVVKLTRTLMIIPISVGLSISRRRRADAGAGVPWRRVVPLFLVLFLVASLVDTLGWIPGSWHPALTQLATFLITVALAGIGLGTRIGVLRQAGPRPLLLGGALWVIVAVSSLLLQAVFGGI